MQGVLRFRVAPTSVGDILAGQHAAGGQQQTSQTPGALSKRRNDRRGRISTPFFWTEAAMALFSSAPPSGERTVDFSKAKPSCTAVTAVRQGGAH